MVFFFPFFLFVCLNMKPTKTNGALPGVFSLAFARVD